MPCATTKFIHNDIRVQYKHCLRTCGPYRASQPDTAFPIVCPQKKCMTGLHWFGQQMRLRMASLIRNVSQNCYNACKLTAIFSCIWHGQMQWICLFPDGFHTYEHIQMRVLAHLHTTTSPSSKRNAFMWDTRRCLRRRSSTNLMDNLSTAKRQPVSFACWHKCRCRRRFYCGSHNFVNHIDWLRVSIYELIVIVVSIPALELAPPSG